MCYYKSVFVVVVIAVYRTFCLLFRIVQKLQKLSASSDQREDGDGAETQEEFGSGIKFALPAWPQEDTLSSSDSEDEDVLPREIDLRYSGETVSEHQARKDKENRVADGKESVDSVWLQKQVCVLLQVVK